MISVRRNQQLQMWFNLGKEKVGEKNSIHVDINPLKK